MIYIRIDTTTLQAKKFVEFVETFPFAKILIEPNAVKKRAITAVRKDKTKRYKNAKELVSSFNK